MVGEQPWARGFAPIINPHVRLLILGSLPGAASIEAGRYYAHPRNQFWRLMGDVIGRELIHLAYEARLRTLVDHHIGLWDMIAEADRPGSLDHAIRQARINPVDRLIARLPQLKLIAFNGKKSANLGQRQLGLSQGASGLDVKTLPSSSAAHTRPFEEKLTLWCAALVPALAAAPV